MESQLLTRLYLPLHEGTSSYVFGVTGATPPLSAESLAGGSRLKRSTNRNIALSNRNTVNDSEIQQPENSHVEGKRISLRKSERRWN